MGRLRLKPKALGLRRESPLWIRGLRNVTDSHRPKLNLIQSCNSYSSPRAFGVYVLGLMAWTLCAAPPERATNDFVFIDNGELRLGVKKSSGAGIAYLALNGGENVINHWDRGRLVQQSYYGAKDGSMWDKQRWRWNPVQGGDWHGNPARVLEFKGERESLYAKSMGKHWASGADLPDVMFEEWISLTGKVAHVKFRMTYTGTNSHPKIHHELPAVFVEPQFDTLLVYQGTNAWKNEPVARSKPGWPNESRKFTEHWAAFVNTNDFGVGAFVPVADTLTCYRFGDGKREHGACSYFAPIKSFAITPGMKFEYDVWLTIGTAQEIRARFQKIRTTSKPQALGLRRESPLWIGMERGHLHWGESRAVILTAVQSLRHNE